ncbi:hypothetical protein DFJ58DRAFT_841618 [Suillus subalutaceus]|uniref:uncharacterized protein n=1 Tax=Suillus subalutaceus TaxID=48586 RepID=UPI001B86DFB8|nr:uncharacterized protein DFJ58DRAFT_841618 [Suillus subalutaceus]KAG1853434.1 hypothetical protein DFJ58DRAFT_841618 [Suillus subalutaceus]
MNEYYEYFEPDYKLDMRSSNREDMNTPEYGFRRYWKGVGMFIKLLDIPNIPMDNNMDDLNQDEDLIPPDVRRHRRLLDSHIQADRELSDSDDEREGGVEITHIIGIVTAN